MEDSQSVENKVHVGKWMYIWTDLNNVIGYSITIGCIICVYVALLSLVNLNGSQNFQDIAIPIPNYIIEIFLFLFPSIIMFLLHILIYLHQRYIIANGYHNLVKGTRTFLVKWSIVFIISNLIVGTLIIVVVHLNTTFDFIIPEAIYILISVAMIAFFLQFEARFIEDCVDEHVKENSLKKEKKRAGAIKVGSIRDIKFDENAVVAMRNSEFTKWKERMIMYGGLGLSASIPLLVLVIYVYVTALYYREASITIKGVVLLIIHPFFREILEILFTVEMYEKAYVHTIHPFYFSFKNVSMKSSLILLRRIMFLNSMQYGLKYTAIFITIAACEDIFIRCQKEKIEFYYRSVTRRGQLSKIVIEEKRRYWSYDFQTHSIYEISSALIASAMVILFSSNRLVVDLGYHGIENVNLTILFLVTVVQLIAEVLVSLSCSLVFSSRKETVLNFFFEYRNVELLWVHLSGYVFAVHYIMHNFKTIPSASFCSDPNNPCTCNIFPIYQAICNNATVLNLFNLNSLALTSGFGQSDVWFFFGSIFGSIFIISFSFYYLSRGNLVSESMKEVFDKKNEESRRRLDCFDDDASIGLMQKSSLQQVINSMETLVRGANPAQATLLKKAISLIKENSANTNAHKVDVEGILEGSSEDAETHKWLQGQLMSHDDMQFKKNKSIEEPKVDSESVGDKKEDEEVVKAVWKTASRPMSVFNPSGPSGVKVQAMRGKNLRQSESAFREEDDKGDEDDDSGLREKVALNDEKGDISISSDSPLLPPPLLNIGMLKVKKDSIDKKPEEEAIFTFPNEEAIGDNFLSYDFNVFEIKGDYPQARLGFKCLESKDLISRLKLPRKQLGNILTYIERNYSMVNYHANFTGYAFDPTKLKIKADKKNESKEMQTGNLYHNNLHGADVLQSSLYFCHTYKDIADDFHDLDTLCILFAAYIHDFNHPGVNTTYVIADWPHSGISTTFGTDSPLEKHHLAYTFNLMRYTNEYNFLSDSLINSIEDLSYFRRLVTECVLATDLAKSMAWLAGARIQLISTEHKTTAPLESQLAQVVAVDEKRMLELKILKMQLVIKCADVGHPTRPLTLHLEWSRRIKEEFFLQGDREKKKGIKISPLCDRSVPEESYPQGQIGFINYVTKPVINLMTAVCISDDVDDKPWVVNLQNNLDYWEKEKIRLTSSNVQTQRRMTNLSKS